MTEAARPAEHLGPIVKKKFKQFAVMAQCQYVIMLPTDEVLFQFPAQPTDLLAEWVIKNQKGVDQDGCIEVSFEKDHQNYGDLKVYSPVYYKEATFVHCANADRVRKWVQWAWDTIRASIRSEKRLDDRQIFERFGVPDKIRIKLPLDAPPKTIWERL